MAESTYSPPHQFNGNGSRKTHLGRSDSLISLARAPFSVQLHRLTSLSLPSPDSLHTRILDAEDPSESLTRLRNIATDVHKWINTASTVLSQLDADDDVEWAARGKDSLAKVENAAKRFGEIVEARIAEIASGLHALGIGGPDWIAVVGIETMREVALGGLDPFVELVRLQHERHQRLAGLRIFGVGHRQDRIHQMQFSRFSDRTDRHVGVVHVLGDVLLGRIVASRDVDRDAVVGPVDLVAEERLVVERVVP